MKNQVTESVTDSQEVPTTCFDCGDPVADITWRTRTVHTPTLSYVSASSRRASWRHDSMPCQHDEGICASNIHLDTNCDGSGIPADTAETYLERVMRGATFQMQVIWEYQDEELAYCESCGENPADGIDCSVDYCYSDHIQPILGEMPDLTTHRLVRALVNGAHESGVTRDLLKRIDYALSGAGASHVSWQEYDFEYGQHSQDSLDYLEQWVKSECLGLLELRASDEVANHRRWRLNFDRWLCSEHEDYSECEQCGGWDSDLREVEDGWNTHTWCDSCVDDSATYCEPCDRYETDSYECDERGGGLIQSYSYRPSLSFFALSNSGHRVITSRGSAKDRSLYMGFELEVESRGSYDVRELAQFANETWEDSVYFKQDGSLNNGVEIVSHPHTLAAFKSLDWSVLDGLAERGARSWNTSTCGFHVHLARSAFNGVRHLWLFGQFFAQNGDDIVRIAGRNGDYGRLDDEFKRTVGAMAKGRSGARYNAINFQNSDTIEVRVFKGSLKIARVHAYLELCDAVHAYSSTITANGVLSKAKSWKDAASKGALSWGEFATFVKSNIDTYPNLATHLYDNHTPSTTTEGE